MALPFGKILFTEFEKQLILDLTQPHLAIIENKETNGVILAQKAKVFAEISKQFNNTDGVIPRTEKQIRQCYLNLKKKFRRKGYILQEQVFFTEFEKQLLRDLLKPHLTTLENWETNGVKLAQKARVFAEISKQFNNTDGVVPRTEKKIRQCYLNLKKKSQREGISLRQALQRTVSDVVPVTLPLSVADSSMIRKKILRPKDKNNASADDQFVYSLIPSQSTISDDPGLDKSDMNGLEGGKEDYSQIVSNYEGMESETSESDKLYTDFTQKSIKQESLEETIVFEEIQTDGSQITSNCDRMVSETSESTKIHNDSTPKPIKQKSPRETLMLQQIPSGPSQITSNHDRIVSELQTDSIPKPLKQKSVREALMLREIPTGSSATARAAASIEAEHLQSMRNMQKEEERKEQQAEATKKEQILRIELLEEQIKLTKTKRLIHEKLLSLIEQDPSWINIIRKELMDL